MEMREKFLPIGSVVLLKGGKKKLMITGFCSMAEDDRTKVYDYTGCIYPEGYLNSNQICLFDHEQIEEIFFIGYEDEEEKEFKDSLEELVIKFKEGLSDGDFSDDDDDEFDEDEEDIDIDENAGDLERL